MVFDIIQAKQPISEDDIKKNITSNLKNEGNSQFDKVNQIYKTAMISLFNSDKITSSTYTYTNADGKIVRTLKYNVVTDPNTLP
jgi:hypothetical protein